MLPTCNRPLALTLTLASVALQEFTDLRLIVADQSATVQSTQPSIAALIRVIEARSATTVEWHHRQQRHGIAEQRDFLLNRSNADAVLFLDDDVLMEPWVLGTLLTLLAREHCGFIGAFPSGLSFRDDVADGTVRYCDSTTRWRTLFESVYPPAAGALDRRPAYGRRRTARLQYSF